MNSEDDWQFWWYGLKCKWHLWFQHFIFRFNLQNYSQLFLFWIMESSIFIKDMKCHSFKGWNKKKNLSRVILRLALGKITTQWTFGFGARLHSSQWFSILSWYIETSQGPLGSRRPLPYLLLLLLCSSFCPQQNSLLLSFSSLFSDFVFSVSLTLSAWY